MRLRNILIGLGVTAAAFAISGGASAESPNPNDPNPNPNDPTPGKLGDWNYSEYGPPKGPLVVLFVENADAVAPEFVNMGFHVVAPLGQYLTQDGIKFVDPMAADRKKAELDTGVSLAGFAAASMLKWSPNDAIIVVGVGEEPGTLAALVGLTGNLAVRNTFAGGFALTTAQIPSQPTGQGSLDALTWGPNAQKAKEAAALAVVRGFKVTLAEYDGEEAPATDFIVKWVAEMITPLKPMKFNADPPPMGGDECTWNPPGPNCKWVPLMGGTPRSAIGAVGVTPRSAPAPGPVTADERNSVDFVLQAAALRDGAPPILPTTIIPAPYNRKPEWLEDDWWRTFVSLALTYRDPARAWMQAKNLPAPIDLDDRPGWKPVFERMRQYFDMRKAAMIAEDLAEKSKLVVVPPSGPLTADEAAAFAPVLAAAREERPFVIPTTFVPAPWNSRPDWLPERDWMALAVLHLVYSDPTKAWRAMRNDPPPRLFGPNTGAQSAAAIAWTPTLARIRNHLDVLGQGFQVRA